MSQFGEIYSVRTIYNVNVHQRLYLLKYIFELKFVIFYFLFVN